MGTFTLIESFVFSKLNKAEILSLLKRFMALMPAAGTDSPEEISVLSDEGVPALNITAQQVTRMNEIIAAMEELTMQSRSTAETPEMQAVESDRDTTGNYIVRRILNPDQLPLAAERDAARVMEPFFRGYAGLADLPVEQETVVVNGLLADLAKPEYAEQVATLGLTAAIAELKRLNDKYVELSAARDKERSKRTANVNFTTLSAEAQDLLDDMCALANASSLLQPSTEASDFIRDANFLFKQARTAYKQRAKKGAETDGGDPMEPTEPTEPGNPDGGETGETDSPSVI